MALTLARRQVQKPPIGPLRLLKDHPLTPLVAGAWVFNEFGSSVATCIGHPEFNATQVLAGTNSAVWRSGQRGPEILYSTLQGAYWSIPSAFLTSLNGKTRITSVMIARPDSQANFAPAMWSTPNRRWSLFLDATNHAYTDIGTTNANGFSLSPAFTNGAYAMWAGTYDGTTFTLYQDGVSVGSVGAAGGSTYGDELRLGTHPAGVGNDWEGAQVLFYMFNDLLPTRWLQSLKAEPYQFVESRPVQKWFVVAGGGNILSGGPTLQKIQIAGTLSVPLTYTLSGGPVLQKIQIAGVLSLPTTPGSVTDTNVYFSPYTWYSNGGGSLLSNNVSSGSTYAMTNCFGSYIKFKANCTGVTMTFDNSVWSANGDVPVFQVSVDDGAFSSLQPTAASTSQSLASGLSAGVHKFEIRLMYSTATSNDRWNWSAAPYQVLKVTGFTITAGTGATSAWTLRPNRALFFGDSITEGWSAGISGSDAAYAYVPQVAEAFNAEYGHIGLAGQGWATAGNGNVPKFHTPGTTTEQTWRWYASGKSRLVSSAFSPSPTYVFVMHGTNDGAISNATLTAAATDWLTAMQTAAPSAKVFLVLPPNGVKRTALSGATLNSNQYFIDLDTNAPSDQLLALGLSGSASWRAADGLHLNARAHAEVAAKLTQAAMNAIQPGTGSGGVRRRFQ